jgi:dTMP kinase
VKGRLIVIEGIDGTGKTTLASALTAALRAQGGQVTASYEPTRGKYGARLRALAESGREKVSVEEEIALFIADRDEHQRNVVLPALNAGQDVILDRYYYYYSSMAYQGARGGDVAEIERRNRAIAREPDILIMLQLPVEEALRRITQKRGEIPNLFEGREYLEKVAEIFAGIQHPNLIRLDARKTTDQLVEEILNKLAKV